MVKKMQKAGAIKQHADETCMYLATVCYQDRLPWLPALSAGGFSLAHKGHTLHHLAKDYCSRADGVAFEVGMISDTTHEMSACHALRHDKFLSHMLHDMIPKS